MSHPGRARRILKNLAWTWLALVLLVTFTLMKLPEARLKNFVLGHLQVFLSPMGLNVSAEHASLTFGFGYELDQVVLSAPPPALPVKIDRIRVSPSFSSLFTGRLGADLKLQQADSSLKARFSQRGQDARVQFELERVNLGRLGVIPMIAGGLRGSATVSGSGRLAGDLSIPSSLAGEAKLQLGRLTLEEQKVQGFNLPPIQISEGSIEVQIEPGKALIRRFSLGKKGNASDDLVGNLSGDLQLSRNWYSSAWNTRARFQLSDRILKSKELSLLEMILSPAKTPDGDFAYSLTGPFSAPMALPGGTPGNT